MKRKYAALLLLALALALPACGKKEDTTAEPTTALETPTPQPTEEPTPEPTEAPEETPTEAPEEGDPDDIGDLDLNG
ncbi:MAG: hypothetical protein K2K87_04805, partial [Lachnospiraceae bacterium]|nr:hypothetical protein [Lachnospiraceae bacterium]